MPDWCQQMNSKADKLPLVSVIIPCFNREWSVEQCLESVFEQTYRPIECIAVDDGSSDGTLNKLHQLANSAPDGVDVKVLRQSNQGANRARNTGLRCCHGKLICFLDSDELMVQPNTIFSGGSCCLR